MNIYSAGTTDFNNNGLGFLTDTINASIVDELNGDYELTIEYPIKGHLSEHLVEHNYIKSRVADGTKQLFVITNIEKNYNTIVITAKHIFYELLFNMVEDVYPQDLNGTAFLERILNNTQYPTNFTAYSDISSTATARYVRKNPVECILGADNSMVQRFGGELKRDNYTINFLSRVGADYGLKAMFGKNITGIDININTDETYTRIMPLGYDSLMLPEKYIDSPLIDNYPFPRIGLIKFEDIKYDPEDEEAYHTEEEAYQALRNEVAKLYANGIDKAQISISIDWIELSKTDQYKDYANLERVNLGDTIHATILGVDFETRVKRTVYNPLNDRVEEFEIGTIQASLASTMNSMREQIQELNPTSILQTAQENATNLITQAMGGYVYKTNNELYIMDTDNPTTATRVWRWNINGLGYSSTGINGPYGIAMTMDGSIVADYITTGVLRTSVIEGYDSLITQVSSQGTEISNNYQELLSKFDGLATVDDITSVTNTVSQLMTDTYTKTEIQQIVDGTGVDGVAVSAVKSTSGTFDENGMTYAQTGASTTSTINQSGLQVNSTGDTSEELLFAGYDETTEEALVRVANLYLTRYLGLADWRIEEIEDATYGQGVGFFYLK